MQGLTRWNSSKYLYGDSEKGEEEEENEKVEGILGNSKLSFFSTIFNKLHMPQFYPSFTFYVNKTTLALFLITQTIIHFQKAKQNIVVHTPVCLNDSFVTEALMPSWVFHLISFTSVSSVTVDGINNT